MDPAGLFRTASRMNDSRSNVSCRFFSQGRCKKGSTCPYSHAALGQAETRDSFGQDMDLPHQSKLQDDSLPKVTCRFFLLGNCKNGERCPFAHTKSKQTAELQVEGVADDTLTIGDQVDSRPDSWSRDLGGALVNFGDGAVVAKVSFPSDFSAVRINGLPRDTDPSSVVTILEELGFSIPTESVRVPPRGENDCCSADIRVEDPQFAMSLCAAMKRSDTYEIIPINAPMPQGTNYHRVDTKKVYCSWHKPTKTAWLNFGNQSIASKISQNFSSGNNKILGQRVKCEAPTRSSGYRNPLPWTVRLSDVPGSAEKDHVIRDIPPKMCPRHVELGTPNYEVDLSRDNTLIESLLLQAGPLEGWEGSIETRGKRFKAKARFMNEADARRAANMYNDKPLPFNKNGKLTVQLVHSARFKVTTRAYDAVELEINAYKQEWNSMHLRYVAYPPHHNFRVLKIEGEISGDVAKAKATLDKVLSGEVMTVDEKPIWAKSFAVNGQARQSMKAIESELGIIIIREHRRCQLRVLGPRSKFEKAQRALAKLAKEDSCSIFVIELDAEKLSCAFRGGYRAVEAAIGREKVTLDIVSTPRRIVVVGSEADFETAQAVLQGAEAPSRMELKAPSSEDCAICWTEAENAIRTRCEHVYCAGCFEDLCLNGASAVGPDPSIQCQGGGGKCCERFLLSELQDHLSSTTLEDVFEAAFKNYVASHPNDVRYCPTPDCGQIYRTVSSARGDTHVGTVQNTLFTCPECLVAVCKRCHVSHDGLTCAEHHDRVSGGYEALQKAKRKFSIQDCPKCGTMIQKSSGCNHMTCPVCSTHICWVCLETFKSGDLVYPHMTGSHGGIGVDYYPDLA